MLYRTYLSFEGKEEHLTAREKHAMYPLGSLTFGTVEMDWANYLGQALSLQARARQLHTGEKQTVQQRLAQPDECIYTLVAAFSRRLNDAIQAISPALAMLMEDHYLALWRFYKEQALPAERRIMDAVSKGECPSAADRNFQRHATEMQLTAELLEGYCRSYPNPAPGLQSHLNTEDNDLITAAEQLLDQLIESLRGLEELKQNLMKMIPLTLCTSEGRPAPHPATRLLELQRSPGDSGYADCAMQIECLRMKMIEHSLQGSGKIKKGSVAAAFAYTGDCLPAMVFLEFQQMCIQELPVAVCAFCGRYFVPFFGNAKYCQRVADSESGQTCQEIGPKQKYNRKVEANPARLLYNQERNKRHMRCVRAQGNEKMLKDYKAWCSMAQKLLTKYELGEIDMHSFEQAMGM